MVGQVGIRIVNERVRTMSNIQEDVLITTKPPTISALNADILWHVFYLNANMDNDKGNRVYHQDRLKVEHRQNRALFVTWASCQVCRAWRHLLLNSSVIWGRLVDLDALSLAGPALRDEVMHRSGSSVLWIYGKVFAQKESERDFFTSTLARHWARIGRLRVTIQQSKLIPAYAWKVLYEPAPHLEFLYLRSPEGMTLPVPEDEGQNTNLFADDAPLLRQFVSWKINFKFGNSPGWLKSVRHLDISYMTTTTMGQWLEMLDQCPQIERLDLIKPFTAIVDTTQKFRSVKLPKLNKIYIIHELTSCVVFLDHVYPREGCCLQLDTPDDMDEQLSVSTIAMAKRVLTRYSTSWFNNHVITNLLLSISHKQIKISDDIDQSGHDQQRFTLQINCQSIGDLPTLFSLLDIFTSCNLESITTLCFDVDIFPEQSLNAEVFRFLLSMSSVETLTFWQPSTIPALLSFAQNPDIDNEATNPSRTPLFPLLGTLATKTIRIYYEQNTLDTLQKQISEFLSWRREIGHFVGLLDITSLGQIARIHVFDNLSGLRVLHQHKNGTREEYICQPSSSQPAISGKNIDPVS